MGRTPRDEYCGPTARDLGVWDEEARSGGAALPACQGPALCVAPSSGGMFPWDRSVSLPYAETPHVQEVNSGPGGDLAAALPHTAGALFSGGKGGSTWAIG